MIHSRVLKGFRDSLPKQELIKQQIIHTLEAVFQSWGFVPIDTPVLEYTEVLLGKGGGETEKQIFHFFDNGKRDVAMRFDLTVPFARFMATNRSQLQLPFKRFHIAKVWRGENPQKGRYREFYQCDFDSVGIDSTLADYEILAMMSDSLEALELNNFTIKVAHRGLFNLFLSQLGVENDSVEILRIVDKLAKIGQEEVTLQLVELLAAPEKAQAILGYIQASVGKNNEESLAYVETLTGGTSPFSERLREVLSLLEKAGIAQHFALDFSITRGLDYYTGIVYETFLDELPEIGSICSGGRYNDLASLYTKEHLPGVGSSIGLDRLLAALEELEHPLGKQWSSADVLILNQDDRYLPYAARFARALRQEGVRCDIYYASKKMAVQFKYAEHNNIPYSVTFDEYSTDQGLGNLRCNHNRQDYLQLAPEAMAKIILSEQSAC